MLRVETYLATVFPKEKIIGSETTDLCPTLMQWLPVAKLVLCSDKHSLVVAGVTPKRGDNLSNTSVSSCLQP
jgi:hypothetical protein